MTHTVAIHEFIRNFRMIDSEPPTIMYVNRRTFDRIKTECLQLCYYPMYRAMPESQVLDMFGLKIKVIENDTS